MPYYSTFFLFLTIVQSCKDVKLMDKTSKDGEFTLWYSNKSIYIKVYCHNMTGDPSEYLSLPAGGATNYIYKGSRSNSATWGNPCRGRFNKVRLILAQSIKILRSDTTFMTTDDQKCSPLSSYIKGYGAAGDCVWGSSGEFKIDLSGTPYKIPNAVSWASEGYQNRMKSFVKSSDGKTVSAFCGGYCGSCNPLSGKYIPLDFSGSYL